jgi:hypothetical protein
VTVNAVRMVLLVAVAMTGQEQVPVIMALTVKEPEVAAVKAVNKASMPEAAKAAMILAKAAVKVTVPPWICMGSEGGCLQELTQLVQKHAAVAGTVKSELVCSQGKLCLRAAWA